jgi:hypothetical protein
MTSAKKRQSGLIISLMLMGYGEALLRMEKRLGCAARRAAVQLHLVVDKNYQPRDISLAHLPVVTYQGQRVFEGLPSTETIQAWLEKVACQIGTAAG